MKVSINGAFRLSRAAMLFLVFAVLLSSCVAFMPDRIHYVWDAEETGTAPRIEKVLQNTDFVGLAFSGGGSRAAYFAAAGAEALHEQGLLEQVTHISSVSGGSMAASYLATTPPEACAAKSDCAERYFDEYKDAMRQNYFRPMAIKQVTKPNRFLSPTRRASSLQDALDTVYLNDITFGDLPSSPVILINAASYDDGSRFVFSNRPIANEEYTDTPLNVATLRSRNFALPDCAEATPDDFPVSLAVATSAAFPPALGPVAIEVPPACGNTQTQYWHLGDGGILENTGVETLQEILMLDSAAGQAPTRAVILSFDAGKRESVEQNLANRDLRLWTSDPGRVVSITNMRADAYWSLIWEEAAALLDFPVEIITIRYTENVPSVWPSECSGGQRKSGTISERLQAVPTRFSITPCDAALMEASARIGVERALAQHPELLSLRN